MKDSFLAMAIERMIRYHGSDESTAFYAVAMQIGASLARSGNGFLAKRIRDAVDSAKAGNPTVDPADKVVGQTNDGRDLDQILSLGIRLAGLRNAWYSIQESDRMDYGHMEPDLIMALEAVIKEIS